MERKIGEIFEFGGEWYQCLKSESCDECAFLNSNCIDNPSLKCSVDDRTDNCAAIFKKLEKWGGPYPNADKLYQLYRLPMNIEKLPPHTEGINLVRFDIVEIEIKQTKEDMEENKLNLKPFDIQKAREGKPVCTRDGRRARIICFDSNGGRPIVALVTECDDEEEIPYKYHCDGSYNCQSIPSDKDLMMLPEKKEGWVNVYKRENEYVCENECNVSTGITVYKSEGEAKRNIDKNEIYVNTIKISWEE